MGHRIGNSTKFSGSASIAVLAVAMMQPVSTPRVKAQALQPVVDVCTGITLPRSAVTDIIGAVNQPIVNQIETTVNGNNHRDLGAVAAGLDPRSQYRSH